MEHLFATRTVDSAPASIHAHLWEQERAKESIRRTYRRFADAWSEGDVALVASLLASDCDHVTLARAGQVRRSRADLVESWTAAFARRCPDFSVRMTASLQSIRLLGDRLALVDGDLEYGSGIGAGAVHQRQSVQPFAAVMTRGDDDWLILSIRVGAAGPAAAVDGRVVESRSH